MEKVARYSDNIPYNERKFWYFTHHGIGPGTIPKDLKLLQVIETAKGDYICLDGILNTSELKYFDLTEKVPRELDIVEEYLRAGGFFNRVEFELKCDYGEVSITIFKGNYEDDHLLCNHIMKEHGYRLNSELMLDDYIDENFSFEGQTYSSTHIYIREDGKLFPEYTPF